MRTCGNIIFVKRYACRQLETLQSPNVYICLNVWVQKRAETVMIRKSNTTRQSDRQINFEPTVRGKDKFDKERFTKKISNDQLRSGSQMFVFSKEHARCAKRDFTFKHTTNQNRGSQGPGKDSNRAIIEMCCISD